MCFLNISLFSECLLRPQQRSELGGISKECQQGGFCLGAMQQNPQILRISQNYYSTTPYRYRSLSSLSS